MKRKETYPVEFKLCNIALRRRRNRPRRFECTGNIFILAVLDTSALNRFWSTLLRIVRHVIGKFPLAHRMLFRRRVQKKPVEIEQNNSRR